MANIKTDFHGEGKPFWFKNGKDTDAQDIGGILDKWSNLRGVTCDGNIAGLKINEAGSVHTLKPTLIEGVYYLILYNCSGVEVARWTESA